MTGNMLITQTVTDGIALLVMDNPPVNALSDGLRTSLLAALQRLAGQADVHAVILTGRGCAFIAGADINEMDALPVRPFLPEVVDAIAAMPMPVIAAINGTCLGGGAEIALACDGRFAVLSAVIGLPETKLGIIPGAGGTQRLPRLVGIGKAIGMICEGVMLKADDALAIGLLDAVVDDPLLHAQQAWRVTGKRNLAGRAVPPADAEAITRLAARITGRYRRSEAVMSALELLLASRDLPFAEGVRRERETFLRLRESEAARALRYLFKAERLASRSPGAGAIRTISQVGVAGGGTMGSGIALSFVQAGVPVVVLERDAQAAEAAQDRLFSMIDTLVARGRLTGKDADGCRRRVGFDHDLSAAANCDLIVEAVFEEYEAKQALFSGLGPHLKMGTIVASNTSYLDIDRLAAMLPEPANVAGMHFFAPANVMKLVEVIRGAETAPSVVATINAVARRLGKVPVTAGNAEGFIGNRIFSAYRRQMEYLVEDGASPKDVDEALEAFGFAMGPFSVFDMSGLDIAWAMRKRKAADRDPQERYVRIADRLCEAGLFGRKSGRGWYDYTAPTRTLSAEAQAFIDEERRRKGIVPKHFAAEEIVDVALRAMAQEGQALLAQGVAERASDIDMVLVTGYGFPRDKGGPMYVCGMA
jgi:3-hydroxyacyl-CoA dehydrogenase